MFFDRKLIRFIFLFVLGGYSYCIIEVVARGFSHISMLLAGGLSFVLVGGIYEMSKMKIPTIVMMLIGTMIITTIEYITGCIVNLRLGLEVWDYTPYSFNFRGQICLWHSIAWFCLSYSIIKLFHIINSWTKTWGQGKCL